MFRTKGASWKIYLNLGVSFTQGYWRMKWRMKNLHNDVFYWSTGEWSWIAETQNDENLLIVTTCTRGMRQNETWLQNTWEKRAFILFANFLVSRSLRGDNHQNMTSHSIWSLNKWQYGIEYRWIHEKRKAGCQAFLIISTNINVPEPYGQKNVRRLGMRNNRRQIPGLELQT